MLSSAAGVKAAGPESLIRGYVRSLPRVVTWSGLSAPMDPESGAFDRQVGRTSPTYAESGEGLSPAPSLSAVPEASELREGQALAQELAERGSSAGGGVLMRPISAATLLGFGLGTLDATGLALVADLGAMHFELASMSIGWPHRGRVVGAVRMTEGPGRLVQGKPEKSWATRHTVALLEGVFLEWAELDADAQPILVGNLSRRRGGKVRPHASHQSGRDVDLSFVQKLAPGQSLNWRVMNRRRLDAEGTWRLIELLMATGEVESIFIDRRVQSWLYAALRSRSDEQAAVRRAWLALSRHRKGKRAPEIEPVIHHVRGHDDHMHVRFRCQATEVLCRDERPRRGAR